MLQQLIAEACQHKSGSWERQKKLNEIVFEIQRSKKIWKDSSVCAEDYEDALQATWILFCKKIGDYDPTKGEVIHWFNGILKNQLKKIRSFNHKEQERRVFKSEEEFDLIENLPASKTPIPILEDTLKWIKSDEKLSKIHLRNRPNITCKILLLRRLPPEETTWEKLAAEFSVSMGTLSCFYQRKCYPYLLEFAKQQGYINP